jgi:2-amino-4-hydroxy-6-hydroxymethyldihydropteridine diphosphokinase
VKPAVVHEPWLHAGEPGPSVVVAIGANLADPVTRVREAAAALRELSLSDFKTSSLWSSTPVNCPPGSPDFVNAVVLLHQRLAESPEKFLERLQGMEHSVGRVRSATRNAPRTLDLDLIAFGSEVRQSVHLTLPHPRAHLRRFVLEPLVEIAPDLQLPGWRFTAREYLASLNTDEVLTRIGSMH